MVNLKISGEPEICQVSINRRLVTVYLLQPGSIGEASILKKVKLHEKKSKERKRKNSKEKGNSQEFQLGFFLGSTQIGESHGDEHWPEFCNLRIYTQKGNIA